MSNCSNHPKELYGESDMAKVAEAISNLHYETLAKLLYELKEKIYYDSVKDRKAGRTNLAHILGNAVTHFHYAAFEIETAWQISKPFMKE